MTGIPIYNVNNNCATGSSALHLAKNLIAGGVYSCVLAAGFEKMARGSLGVGFQDRVNPIQHLLEKTVELMPTDETPKGFAPLMFGNAGMEHMKLFGTKPEHFAKVAAKNHKHSLNNPYSQFQDGHSTEAVLKSPKIYGVLTKLQCCPTSDGAGAAIVCDEATLIKLRRENEAVEIVAMEMTTDVPSVYNNCREIVGSSMTKQSVKQALSKAGITAKDVGVVELHDCFSANELITYEALGLCEEGKAGEFIDKGDNTYGGKVVVNPSGGLTSKGHPLGATGFAQCAELCWQLRGIAGKRQVSGLKYALQHNLGLGGACVVGVYKKYNNEKSAGTSELKELEAMEKKAEQQLQAKL